MARVESKLNTRLFQVDLHPMRTSSRTTTILCAYRSLTETNAPSRTSNGTHCRTFNEGLGSSHPEETSYAVSSKLGLKAWRLGFLQSCAAVVFRSVCSISSHSSS